MERLIVYPQNKEQLDALKPYDPEFVAMILQGDEDLKAGKGVKVDIDNLWK